MANSRCSRAGGAARSIFELTITTQPPISQPASELAQQQLQRPHDRAIFLLLLPIFNLFPQVRGRTIAKRTDEAKRKWRATGSASTPTRSASEGRCRLPRSRIGLRNQGGKRVNVCLEECDQADDGGQNETMPENG